MKLLSMSWALAALVPVHTASAQTAAAPAAAAADFSTTPAAPGSWVYQPITGGSLARFLDTGAIARVVLQCNRVSRKVTIAHTSAAPSASLFVWTSTLSRTLPARFEQNAMRVVAELSATDPLLDAIAFSRGRFAVQMAGSDALVVTSAPEPARAIEDCRT
ncbi:MAG: hypothetical protein M3Q52_03150 [Pseudomonadota bacterium]|nr:hypothetical protein [Pseudomonadota bacterium]